MTNQKQTVRGRIEAFVRDFAQWNGRWYDPANLDVDFDLVRKDFDSVANAHFLSLEHAVRLGGSLCSEPDHSPREKITAFNEKPNGTAIVETELERSTLPIYYEYTLQKVGADWRIAQIRRFLATQEEKVKDVDLRALLRKPEKPLLVKKYPAGLDKLFTSPLRLQTASWGIVSTRIKKAGKIALPSGFLACDDPGNWASGASVFEQHVSPGSFEIELVLGTKPGIVSAARIIIRNGERTAFAYGTRKHPTIRGRAHSHVIGVDGGMIGLADAKALAALSRRDRERLYSRLADDLQAQGAVSTPLGESTQAWAIRSGCGDGGYESFWELDKKGNPLSLVFDFGAFTMPVWEKVRISVRVEGRRLKIDSDGLKNRGVTVRLSHRKRGDFLNLEGQSNAKAKVYDAEGKLVFYTEDSAYAECDKESAYLLPNNFPKELQGELEVQLYLGQRYDVVEAKH